MFVTAAIMAGSAIYSAQQGKAAAHEQRKAARAQAGAILAQGAEDQRRMMLGYNQQGSQAVANVHASNLMMTGSSQKYIDNMRTEMSRELDWHKRATHAAADAALAGGAMQSAATGARATASGIQGFTGAVNEGYQDYRQWKATR